MPHRSTTYVLHMRLIVTDRVAWSVGRSVCRSVTVVNPTKTVEPIKMPFGLRTLVGPRNHVLDGGPDPPMRRGDVEGKGMPRLAGRHAL